MNAQVYCEMVEQEYRRHQLLLPKIPIKENNSPLISLKESGYNLEFEPSIKKDYKYMVREVQDRSRILNDYPVIYAKKYICGVCGSHWRVES